MTKAQRKQVDDLKDRLAFVQNACNRAQGALLSAENDPLKGMTDRHIAEAKDALDSVIK